jgi:hypothetical protein
MPRDAFDELRNTLKPLLERDVRRASNGSGGVIEPDVRLAIKLLRILAGASYIDLQFAFCIGRSTVFSVFRSTLCAVLATLDMPGVPVDDSTRMHELAEGFRTLLAAPNALWGCVGSIDGIELPIAKPQDKYFLRHYFTRIGLYALPIQCICDASYRSQYMSARCVGSTHDSLVWACSKLGGRFSNGLDISEY